MQAEFSKICIFKNIFPRVSKQTNKNRLLNAKTKLVVTRREADEGRDKIGEGN